MSAATSISPSSVAAPPAAPSVCLFTDSDVFAGTERHIAELAAGLLALGVAVTVACPVPSPLADRCRAAGVAVEPVAKGRLPDRPAIAALRRLSAAGRADIIHPHNGRTALLASFAVGGGGGGSSLVTTQHFIDPARTTVRGPKAWFSRMMHRRIDRRTAAVIAVSSAVAGAMDRRGEAPGRSHVVHNGITPPDPARLADPAATRAALGLPPADSRHPVALCLARLEPEKDVHRLTLAMPLVSAVLPGATLLIAGTGSLEDDLRRRVTALEHPETIRVLGFRTDALDLLHAADVLVLPAPAEPFGLVLLEAMALGKPVIAVNQGGPPEIVDAPRTGLLVPPSDAAALAAAMITLLAEPDLRRRTGDAARERFHEKFTTAAMARRTLDVYRAARRR